VVLVRVEGRAQGRGGGWVVEGVRFWGRDCFGEERGDILPSMGGRLVVIGG